MNTFWLKIVIFAVIVVGLVVLVKTLSPKVEEAMDFDKQSEQLAQAQEAKLQAELAEAEAKARQARLEQTQTKQPASPLEASKPISDEIDQLGQNIQAQRLYQMAEAEFRIARKPLMSFKRCVDYCREIINKFPDSAEAAKARVLLRKMPARERERWKVTDEEMGL